ncbi:MAG: DUF4199 domain-containing protein [Bacteroidales bacterium]|jgi:hypothetical protein|nr:DUF4199 domain-containing protein [Bacteroidales bacterium]
MQSNKWSIAAQNAIILALVTILATLVQAVFPEMPGFMGIIIWVVKLTLSVYLVYYFIKEYSKNFETFSYKQGFNFGAILCLLSSVIGAAYLFLHMGFLFPEATMSQMELIAQSMEASNPEGAEAISGVMEHLPKLAFVFSLIYYTIFGLIVSAIVANYTKKGDIFAQQ